MVLPFVLIVMLCGCFAPPTKERVAKQQGEGSQAAVQQVATAV
jgi:uncharacterized lipoprotein YajG